jgi:hypothetical protein
MKKEIIMAIENNILIEKRVMNVYHHATKSAHMICHNSSVTLPLRAIINDDFLFISIVNGPGNLGRQHTVDLPSWLDYEFLSEGKFKAIHIGNRTQLIIPPGLPEWKLKLTRPTFHPNQEADRIIIND